jgi:hypothetical protein
MDSITDTDYKEDTFMFNMLNEEKLNNEYK